MKFTVKFNYKFDEDDDWKQYEKEHLELTPADAYQKAIQEVLSEKYVGKELKFETYQELIQFFKTTEESLQIDFPNITKEPMDFPQMEVTMIEEPNGEQFKDFLSNTRQGRRNKRKWK